MSLLKNLASDTTIANETDSVGGSRIIPSGLYKATVALAYITVAESGAMALEVTLRTEDKKEVKNTFWMTGGKEKGCKNYYEDPQGGKKYLPGFILANSLALLTLGKEISQLDTEEKVIKAYSYEAKAEVPTKVQMVTELLGQEILAGVIKQTVDKTKKNEATKKYEPTGETRDENEIDKFFRARDRMTTAEIRAKAETAAFAETWSQKWTGVDRNKAKGAAANGTAGAPRKSVFGQPPAASAPAATSSLFA